MTGPINVIKRAIELVETGEYRDLQAVERQLEREHFANAHAYLTGQLRRQLAALCREWVAAKGR
jgi:hypothetical protein